MIIYVALELEWSSYFLIWSGTNKTNCSGDKPFTGTGGFSTRSARVEPDDYSAHISDGFVLSGKIATSTVGPKRPVISAEAMKELTGENR
jgi:hypothetical protein